MPKGCEGARDERAVVGAEIGSEQTEHADALAKLSRADELKRSASISSSRSFSIFALTNPSKIETNADAHRARPECARGHEEGVGEGLALLVGRAGAEQVEIHELRSEGEDRFV